MSAFAGNRGAQRSANPFVEKGHQLVTFQPVEKPALALKPEQVFLQTEVPEVHLRDLLLDLCNRNVEFNKYMIVLFTV